MPISILLLSNLSVANETEVVNTKYSFINEIYDDSWALIIGINKYQNVQALQYAVNDAEAVKDMFVDKYGFKEDNINFSVMNSELLR